jgi:hypothetical protein
MHKPNITHWTEGEIRLLKEFVRTGATPLRAAAALKRTMVSVKAKARLLGTPFPTVNQFKKTRAAKYEAAANAAASDRRPTRWGARP